jgi:hypothetical protein
VASHFPRLAVYAPDNPLTGCHGDITGAAATVLPFLEPITKHLPGQHLFKALDELGSAPGSATGNITTLCWRKKAVAAVLAV